MQKALLDTDILSEIFRAVDATVVERAVSYRATFGRYTLSVITVMEIVKGFHKRGREAALQGFLERLSAAELLDLDQESAVLAGRIYAELERAGQPIGVADTLIAAIAIRHRLILVTGNQAHFLRIQKLGYPLRLDNWRE